MKTINDMEKRDNSLYIAFSIIFFRINYRTLGICLMVIGAALIAIALISPGWDYIAMLGMVMMGIGATSFYKSRKIKH